MARVSILALGPLKNKIPEKVDVEIGNEDMTAFAFVEAHFGIPKTQARMAFIINGRMQKGTTILNDNDEIKVLTMGGAG